MPRQVYLTMKSFTEICKFSAQYATNYLLKTKWVESMGYLFCHSEGDNYIINDAVGMSRGGDTYVAMTPDDLAKIETLQAQHPDDFLGGWFHTHPGLSPFFSSTDIQNQMFYQAGNQDGLGIVFDHSMVSPSFIGFKIFRLRDAQDPNTDYYDVEWTPLDWTEEGLEDALMPIGVSHKIIEMLAFNLGLRENAPSLELPAFTMPNAPNPDEMINNCHTNSMLAFQNKDFLRALIPKRIEIALTEKKGDKEAQVDAMIEFIEWALDAEKILSAEEMVQRLRVLDSDKEFPDDLASYYSGKTLYLHGLVLEKEIQYGTAIEEFEKCLPLLEEDDYFGDCCKAMYHAAECYDFQKEYRKAIDSLDKADKYLQQGIETAKENEEEDEAEFLENMEPELIRFQTRLKAKQSALSKNAGPQRIA